MSGKMLSRPTLELFAAAFHMEAGDVDRLQKIWEGSDMIRVLTGAKAVSPRTAAALRPISHETVSLHEHHYLGRDCLPSRHRTLQVIQALEDGLDRYPYRFDTDAVTVEVGQGCRGVAKPLYKVNGGLYAVALLLTRPLKAGETTTLEYWTSFHYGRPPRPEFRRAAVGRIENVDIRVEFHPDKLPRQVRWAVWDGIDGDVIEEEDVIPDRENAVQRFLRVLENTVVGFHWGW
jgi:hypothetical protein